MSRLPNSFRLNSRLPIVEQEAGHPDVPDVAAEPRRGDGGWEPLTLFRERQGNKLSGEVNWVQIDLEKDDNDFT
jgi:hypothetical protein